MRKSLGFTLIELLVVVAIVAILAAIALPSYSNFIRKSRRADVQSSMQDVALKEERFRADCSTYASAFSGTCPGVATLVFPASPYTSSHYTLAPSAGSATGYTITATAQGSQASDKANGTSCTTLTYVLAAGQITKSPADCWSK